MNKHEIKNCSKCHASFECKAGNITECQCTQIKLSYEETVYVESKYSDCLCIDCLKALQNEYAAFKRIHFDI